MAKPGNPYHDKIGRFSGGPNGGDKGVAKSHNAGSGNRAVASHVKKQHKEFNSVGGQIAPPDRIFNSAGGRRVPYDPKYNAAGGLRDTDAPGYKPRRDGETWNQFDKRMKKMGL